MAKSSNSLPSVFVKDLRGLRFGRLVVKSYVGINPNNSALWLCLCDCGKKKVVVGSNLTRGSCVSCGCYHDESASIRNRTHGKSHFPEYGIWNSAKKRCASHVRWQGRGIKMCERWMKSFEAFFADMGPRPSVMHTLDRINNNGPYCKENCRWATYTEQARNRRDNQFIEFANGDKLTVAEVAENMGCQHQTVNARRRAGWSGEEIIATRVRAYERKKPPQ